MRLSDILPRRLWDALAAKYAYNLPTYPVPVVYLHHGATFAPPELRDADGDGVPDVEENIWSGYQRFHMTTRNWSDIAYSFGVGLSGSVLEGRGWRRQGGATGSPDDSFSLSICAIGNFENQIPSPSMIEAVAQWCALGVREGHILPDFELRGHKDKPYSTSCPGGNLYPHIPWIRARVEQILGQETEVTMNTPIPTWHSDIREAPDGTKNEAVRLWQWKLYEWGYLTFEDVDGVKGPKTRGANKQFETDLGLSNPNGRPQAAGWAALLAGPVPDYTGLTAATTDLVEQVEALTGG